MDITTIITAVTSAVIGIGAVSAFLKRTIPHVIHYVTLSKDSIALLDEVLESLEDGALSADEIDKIKEQVEQLRADLKK